MKMAAEWFMTWEELFELRAWIKANMPVYLHLYLPDYSVSNQILIVTVVLLLFHTMVTGVIGPSIGAYWNCCGI